MAATTDTPPLVGLFYVSSAAGSARNVRSLRRHLAASLRPSELLDQLIELSSLPLTPRGKVDRGRLATLLSARTAAAGSALVESVRVSS